MPLKNGSYKGATWATRRALLDMLKLRGELSSAQMAAELGVSSMAIRQHMQELEAVGDVQSEDRAQGKGRPTKFWSLAPAAARHFPDRHRDLILDLLGNVQAVLGEDAMDRLLDERGKEQAKQYGRRVAGCSTLGERVRELAKLRSEEGYMAEASEGESGVFTLVENHCPICAAAAACQGLCARELTVFERVLGPDCSVERVEHILSGARRCAYEIRPSKAGK